MSERDVKPLFADMLEAIDSIEELTKNHSLISLLMNTEGRL